MPEAEGAKYSDFFREHENPGMGTMFGKRSYMNMRSWKLVFAVIGFSIVLSGCLKVEGTTTVLEDGQIIDRVLLQPKMSMLSYIASFHDAVTHLSERPGLKSHVKEQTFLAEMRAELNSAANACMLADHIFDKDAFVRQGIPYSAVPVPINFKYSGIRGNGCSIQVGPYDPRTLPAGFAEDVLGMHVEPLTGVYNPYRVSVAEVPRPAIEDLPDLEASCASEEKPELCQEEMKIAITVLRDIDEEDPGELRNILANEFQKILANPGMLVGLAEITRLLLRDMSMTWFIPDNAAVGPVRGPGIFTYGQGWRWRGTIFEAIRTLPALSYEVRPRREVAR